MYKRKRTRKKKILIFSLISIILFMTVGYAAFSTNLSITAKGNIYDMSENCFSTSDNGDGTVSITSYDEVCGKEVIIPKTIKGKTVTKIQNGKGWGNASNLSKELGAFANRDITSVTFPDTITSIGAFAFYNNDITELIFPDSVNYIGEECFKNNQISYIKFSKNLNSINSLAFSNNKLTSINLPENLQYLGSGAFNINKVNNDNVYVFDINNDKTINYDVINSFAGDGSYIPPMPNVKKIKACAFRDLSHLNLTLPPTLTTIEDSAFAWCYNINITIPESVTYISPSAFRYSTGTININKSANSIEGAPWGGDNITINWQTKTSN